VRCLRNVVVAEYALPQHTIRSQTGLLNFISSLYHVSSISNTTQKKDNIL